MSNNKQSSVDILWNLIPPDAQNYIQKQFKGYDKAKEVHKEEIIKAVTVNTNEAYFDCIEPDQYYNETFK